MSAQVGYFALLLALALSFVQAVAPFVAARRRDAAIASLIDQAALGQLVFVVIAFASLTYAFVTSDFSLQVVAANSHTTKPLLYKISGVWGNHEGSMLLWVLILAIFGAAVALFGENIPDGLRSKTLAVHGMIGVGFLSFIVLTSNPFAILPNPPADGASLNPILQDPGLALHPPFLYLGYVGFSMAFSFSVAALIEGKVDACWARWVRPWVLAAWSFLTIGITLGSAWAYYTLGWGGWWFWDPVENASLMPWLAGTALLHSALVVERRNALVSWTILLGILTFSLSLIGTFLVRSGVLTSVHAFAQDPARGEFILLLIALSTGGALVLYAIRAPILKTGSSFGMVSRESGLALNNALLSAAAFTVFLGTFYPLVVDLIGGDKISVGPPYYNRTFVPILTPLLIAMAVGPALKWKRDELRAALNRLNIAAIVGSLAAIAVLIATFGRDFLAASFMAIAFWLIAGSALILAKRVRFGSAPLSTSVRLLGTTPRAFFGLVVAHAGMGVLVAGIAGMSSWATEKIDLMRPGASIELSGYELRLRSIDNVEGPNYEAERGSFDILRNGRFISKIHSERRFYPVRQQQTTAAGIRTDLVSNLYVALGEPDGVGAWTVRFYYHPFMPLVWIGALTMALGGLVSLSDRRLRVGVPQRAIRHALPVPAE
ncbi:heme lyase CcmF/NrfE family subunit [Methylocystis sp. MJC1]|jgi:cytochrome c-type biogenesis protein CcmF|uniref:heme lyase CcmF/NrfE family subunit n=1 Tax=Methylocystis sp. MJC1 TaxID=2654282 RepID=UPI0013EBBD7E|nr:heme lyase CcmF/NrfE family subunit [Methylocystis sp. MJC1]KAF2992429.1 Cytochrome c-type biogenesis protein CcmF [Methylocystis sp. MJC1]MBU6526413.1 heme lyase CcmF/NrfE family subunit [Methylocystis sp. MJC1]UZX12858.1 heme lyase CcmF/NrfE family subunit [Methylocystis sp. MJC1]